MLLRFVGKDKSMGFNYGQCYNLEFRSDGKYLWVYTRDGKGCPYASPQALAENWICPELRIGGATYDERKACVQSVRRATQPRPCS